MYFTDYQTIISLYNYCHVLRDSTEATFANKTKPESEDDVENTTTNGMDRYFNEETDQKKSDSKSSDHLQKPGLNGDT